MTDIANILEKTGTNAICGKYTRTYPGGYTSLHCWFIYVNSSGICLMYTDDEESGYYLSENGFLSDSFIVSVGIMECLQKVREIIEGASA